MPIKEVSHIDIHVGGKDAPAIDYHPTDILDGMERAVNELEKEDVTEVVIVQTVTITGGE